MKKYLLHHVTLLKLKCSMISEEELIQNGIRLIEIKKMKTDRVNFKSQVYEIFSTFAYIAVSNSTFSSQIFSLWAKHFSDSTFSLSNDWVFLTTSSYSYKNQAGISEKKKVNNRTSLRHNSKAKWSPIGVPEKKAEWPSNISNKEWLNGSLIIDFQIIFLLNKLIYFCNFQ